jgi:hypothetical protein
VASAIGVHVEPTQRSHWYSNSIVCVPAHSPGELATSCWPSCGVVSLIVGGLAGFGTGGV